MKLQNTIEAHLSSIKSTITEFPWEDPKAYSLWLAQTFHIVNYSTRLLALAGACAPIEKTSFHNRLVDHSKEERGHDKVALVDLKNMGYQINELPCLAPSACMYQIQYFWIQHRNPVSFYGYALALELLAEKYGPDLTRRVVQSHGPKASGFLRIHSEEDQGHNESTLKEIEAFSSSEIDLICENLTLSGGLYKQMLAEVQKCAPSLGAPQSSSRAA